MDVTCLPGSESTQLKKHARASPVSKVRTPKLSTPGTLIDSQGMICRPQHQWQRIGRKPLACEQLNSALAKCACRARSWNGKPKQHQVMRTTQLTTVK